MDEVIEASSKRRSYCSKASDIEKVSLIRSEESSLDASTSKQLPTSKSKDFRSIIDLSESDLFQDLKLNVKINRVSFLFDDTLSLDTVDHLSSILNNSFDKSMIDHCSDPTLCQTYKENRKKNDSSSTDSDSDDTVRENLSTATDTSVFISKGLQIRLNNESSNLTTLSLTSNNNKNDLHNLVNTETQTEISILTDSVNSTSNSSKQVKCKEVLIKSSNEQTSESQAKEVRIQMMPDMVYYVQEERDKNWKNISQVIIRLLIFIVKIVGLKLVMFIYKHPFSEEKFMDYDRESFMIINGVFALISFYFLMKEIQNICYKKIYLIKVLITAELIVDILVISFYVTWLSTKVGDIDKKFTSPNYLIALIITESFAFLLSLVNVMFSYFC